MRNKEQEECQQTEDHDQRFKVLLKNFFSEFMHLFLPREAETFDFSKIDWLDKEVFVDPPAGKRRFLDLVAKLNTRQEIAGQRSDTVDRMLALIHIEVESADSVEPLRCRMFRYYEQLRREHGIPVLPVALYLQVGLEGSGVDIYEEYFADHRALRFEYLYIGLPALDAEEYVYGESPIGIALSSLMKAPPTRKVDLAAEAFRRLIECKLSDWQRWLLCDCLIAYSGLNEEQIQQLEQIMSSEPNKTEFRFTKTWFDKGLEQGIEKGIEQGIEKGIEKGIERAREEDRLRVASMVVRLAQRRLRAIPEQVIDKIKQLKIEQMESLNEALLDIESIDELKTWLHKQQS